MYGAQASAPQAAATQQNTQSCEISKHGLQQEQHQAQQEMTTQGKLASGKAERMTVAGAVGGSSILPGQEPVVNNVVSQPQL